MKTIEHIPATGERKAGAIRQGTGTFWQINLSFFAAGFVTFITLYDVQPLLPVFTREFSVPAALGSLPLSVATCALAVTMLLAGSVSEAVGRKPVMTASLLLTSVLAILTAFSHTFPALLGLRLAQGAALAGLPAVAMAYLGEEIAPSSLGTAMGLYIGGTAVGGMTGRIYTAAATDLFSWRAAIGMVGVLCLVLSLYFARSLPPSTNFRRRPFEIRSLTASLVRHLREPGLFCLYGTVFMTMGAFVTLYNYITFRLLAPPYSLSHTQVSWIFLVYLLGSCSSTLAGLMVHRFGRGPILALSLAVMILGTAATLATGVAGIIAGIALFTCGFFCAHSVASSWVSVRAQTAKAQASSLYLFFYYVGSSVSGTIGGLFWMRWRWEGVAGLISLLLVCGLLFVVRLALLTKVEQPSSGAMTNLEGVLP
jgi:YNFM family putative membrane transporter